MGRKKNSFSKAINHLKSNNIDEKLEMLNEIPTNNTSGLYSVVPGSTTISNTVTTRETETVPDFSTIDLSLGDNPANSTEARDTSGLFDETGTSKLVEPPGDKSYILGPMSSMWYAWGNFSTIGYIRESDRRMVNLGTIAGKLSDWDQQEINSYGQLTLEQAVWFYNTPKRDNAGNDPDNANYRAFYPGPPSNPADAFGRYLSTIVGTPREFKTNTTTTTTTTTQAPIDLQGTDVFSAILARLGSFGNDLKDKFGNVASNIKDFFVDSFSNIADKIGDSIENAATIVSDLATNIGSGIEDIIDWTQNTTNDVIDWARQTDWEAVGNAATTVMNVADAALAVSSIVGFFTPEPLTTAGGAAGLASLALKFKNAYNASRGARGLARGLRGIRIGATGLKNSGFQNLRGDLPGGPRQIHTGSGGLLSPGGRGAYSAPNVGGVRPGSITRPGTGGARYSHGGRTSNPIQNFFDRASGKTPESPGGVVGTVVPGGARGTSIIEPQSVVTPAQFNRGTRMFNDIMNGRFPNSATANRLRSQGIKAGFKPGKSSIPFSELPVLKNEVDYTGLYLNEEEQYSFRSILGEDESDKQDLMIMKLMNIPGFRKKLPAIIKAMEEEIQIVELYQMINGFDQSEGKKENPFRKKQMKESFNSELSENKKRILKEIKKPVVIMEIPKTTLKGYRPGKKNKKLKTNFQGMDKLIGTVKPQQSFKPRDIWSHGWQEHNARLSQDKKNVVLEKIGEGKRSWDYMIKHGTMMNAKNLEEFWGKNPDFYCYYFNGKKYNPIRKEQVKGDYIVFLVDEFGVKSSMLQSELNLKLIEDEENKMLAEYNKLNNVEPISYKKDPLFKKVSNRLSRVIDYPDKPAAKGYPNEPPPELDPNTGMHPRYGKLSDRYKKLDPMSANAMPSTGDSEIDAVVDNQRKKPKEKKLT